VATASTKHTNPWQSVRWSAAKAAKQRDYDLSGIIHPYVHASQAGESLAPRRMGSSPILLVKEGHAGGLAAVAQVADPDGVVGAVASGGAGVSQIRIHRPRLIFLEGRAGLGRGEGAPAPRPILFSRIYTPFDITSLLDP
jgi:hypothetical protein